MKPADLTRRNAVAFVLMLGVVSLLADVTYEGARSITGPFLASFGASATVVGVVAGLGELIGYGLRVASGVLTDRTGRYWTLVFVGYAVNLLAVPLLALAGRWEVAAALLIVERFGKALRVPARDAMLSHAATVTGRGWGFGVHEAMDQVGAVAGPLLMAAVLAARGDFRDGFALLLIPALLALAVLVAGRLRYPNPRRFEARQTTVTGASAFPRVYWLYLGAAALLAAGFADFPLIAYHLRHEAILPDALIPALYAAAMAADAVAALVLGRAFDRMGLAVLLLAVPATAPFAVLVFSEHVPLVWIGMVLWGIGMGAQESVVRAAVAAMVPPDRRATAYGVFNAGFGVAWFAGSAAMGWLYDRSISGVILVSVGLQVAAVPLLLLVSRAEARQAS